MQVNNRLPVGGELLLTRTLLWRRRRTRPSGSRDLPPLFGWLFLPTPASAPARRPSSVQRPPSAGNDRRITLEVSSRDEYKWIHNLVALVNWFNATRELTFQTELGPFVLSRSEMIRYTWWPMKIFLNFVGYTTNNSPSFLSFFWLDKKYLGHFLIFFCKSTSF